MTEHAHRIVIVGGGAGGLPLAVKLGDRYGRRGPVQVTLIDQHATHVWKPLLHEVAAGRMDADAHDLDYPAIAHWHGFRFAQGTLEGLDRTAREIVVGAVRAPEGDEILPRRTFAYDTLILCIGSVSNDFGIPGVAEHAIALDMREDAERFHRRLLAACVRADARAAAGEGAEVRIVIIGAGATGVELAAELRQTTREHAGYGLDHLDPARNIRITILEAAPRILPPLSEHLAAAATDLLQRLDIDVRASQRVIGVDTEGVRTAGGDFIPADLVVWAAGIKASAVLGTLDLEVNRANQLVVGPSLQTTRDPAIFAFGDCAAAPWLGHTAGTLLPPRAQVARQQSNLLLKSMTARLAGRPLPEFRFHDFGSLVSLGELSAVGTLMGRLIGGSMLIQGLIARAMYASLYKLHQISIHGVVRVGLDTLGRQMRGRVEPRVKLH
ncbi:MAG TPA: NAD(P)/FAD-dependent oxidoreductase [Burkholderiaceae bacterium]|nr:NAD(P)/FAD-dependent oxidoreductase [Burkholderiaceae bacterium]